MSAEPMGDNCFFCHNPVDRHDKGTYKMVSGWVGGPRKDSMRLREDMGCYAHETCVDKASRGLPPEQPNIFETLDAVQAQPGPVEKNDAWDALFGRFQ